MKTHLFNIKNIRVTVHDYGKKYQNQKIYKYNHFQTADCGGFRSC